MKFAILIFQTATDFQTAPQFQKKKSWHGCAFRTNLAPIWTSNMCSIQHLCVGSWIFHDAASAASASAFLRVI